MKTFLPTLLVLLFVISCTGPKEILVAPGFENRDLDTLMVTASKTTPTKTADDYRLPVYHGSAKRVNDLLHTKLEVKFDWTKSQLNGKATLTFKPYFYPTKTLILDAKGFDLHKVLMMKKSGSKDALKYTYDNKQIFIDLGRKMKMTEEYTIYIEYTAKPDELVLGGSEAITSDKGLYFINPLGKENKPQQIWTQGETESSSCWFPTIDKPNERCTQEIYMTVQDKFQTLSNGMLINSKKNGDGTRTDYWKMDLPHAPYLFMMTVGEFAVAKEKWNGIELEYWVEQKYADVAKENYAHTPEMLDFFSSKFGKYPWPKYSQVIVRDYVSGAMENTTAVIFGEFIQKNARELIDNGNDAIVAHELIHHWFGDLVTCESWSNLPLNESFANYGEYLWFQHKYGNDRADYHRLGEMSGYLSSARNNIHSLIYFGYDDKEDMFDAHSYNKGGTILHMLRNYLGDDAFFAGLKTYLDENEYAAVESHNLRLAFEKVTGEDLNWFFNQWFYNPGHPQLKIDYGYDATAKKSTVTIEQTQDPARMPAIYELPIAIDIYHNNKPVRHNVLVNQRKQTFSFDASSRPKLINVDADKMLLCEKEDNKTEAEYLFQYNNAPNFFDRFEALDALGSTKTEGAKNMYEKALSDEFWAIRGQAVEMVELNERTLPVLAKIAGKDKNSKVRTEAMIRLASSGDVKYADVAKKAIDTEKPYRVIAEALKTLNALAPAEAAVYAKKMEKEENGRILSAVGNIYVNSGDTKYLSFFEQNWGRVDGYSAIYYFQDYTKLMKIADDETITSSLGKLQKVSTNMANSDWRRYAAAKSVFDMYKHYKGKAGNAEEADKAALQTKAAAALTIFEDIQAKETNEQLTGFYKQFN